MQKTTHPLTDYRARRGLTQAALAEKIGIDSSTLSLIENGHRLPSWRLAAQIEEAIGVSREALRPDIFRPKRKVVNAQH